MTYAREGCVKVIPIGYLKNKVFFLLQALGHRTGTRTEEEEGS